MSNPTRGIECHDLCSAVSPRLDRHSAQRLIITDGYNFNYLPYVLKFGSSGTPYWDISDEWRDLGYQPSFSDTVLHFAAGSHGETTYENSSGGIFIHVTCQIMREPRTLPELLIQVRPLSCMHPTSWIYTTKTFYSSLDGSDLGTKLESESKNT
ncbi:unnamed protein product [Rhizoctonia solani]|uniref:Uncharacterized protein n=1 Tax=Rhizoctonia solani TaxID=456999 RepID=A0A8H3B4Y7_9AGAM|nr:unnamed protein product [Rhizoctonia solani]